MGRRGWLVCLMVAGCGRLDFDLLSDAGAGPGSDGSGFAGLCGFGRVTVVQSGIAADDNMAATLPPALASGCSTGPTVRMLSQDATGILDATTGRPLLAPADLGMFGGGDSYQKGVAYLIMADTPVVVQTSAGNKTFIERATGMAINSFPTSSLTNSHDIGVVMLVNEPISGGSELLAFGSSASGTVAAGVVFTSRIAPSIRTEHHVWSTFEWTDTDSMLGPSAGDTFNIVSGP